MFGMMGVGKSTFSNTLLGQVKFEEGEGADSVTTAIQVESVDKPDGSGKLNVLDMPGMGDPDATRIQMTNKLIKALNVEIKSHELKTVILVKKAMDFRVMAELAWYSIYLKTIFDKEKFDMSKIIIVVTFSD